MRMYAAAAALTLLSAAPAMAQIMSAPPDTTPPGVVGEPAVGVITAPAAPGNDADRTADSEVRVALFELAAGQPLSALARVERVRAGDSARAAALPGAAARRPLLLLLEAEAAERLGAGQTFRQSATELLALPEAPASYRTIVRAQLVLDAYRRGDDVRVAALAAGGETPGLSGFLVALSRYRAGDAARARTLFDSVANGGGAYAPFSRYMRALVIAAGDTVAALDSLRSLSREAGGELANQARLSGARLALQGGRPDDALMLAAEVDTTSGMSAEAALTRAWALYRAGRLADAATAFDAAAARAGALPMEGEALVMSAQARLEAGATEAALSAFSEIADSASLGATAVRASTATALPQAARALVAARAAGILFVQQPAAGKTIAVDDDAGGDTPALLSAVSGGPLAFPADSARPSLVTTSEVMARADSAGVALAGPARGVLFARSAGGGDAYSEGAARLGDADASVALARLELQRQLGREATMNATLSSLGRMAAAGGANLDAVTAQLQRLQDSLAQMVGVLAASRERVRRFIAANAAATQALAAANAASLDSTAAALGRALTAEERQTLEAERLAARNYGSVAALVTRGLDSAIARHPVFAYHDSLTSRLAQSRTLLAETRAVSSATGAAAAAELERRRAGEAGRTDGARAALARAESVRGAAEARLASAVEGTLRVRAESVVVALGRTREAGEFGAAGAAFFLALAADSAAAAQPAQGGAGAVQPGVGAAPAPTRQAAIARLEAVLERYPDSPHRPAALLQTGELLVRQADEAFAAAQRAGGAGGDVPTRPDYSAAIPRLEELVRRYPDAPQVDAGAYTLGTLDFAMGRYAAAAEAFRQVAALAASPYRAEAFFRLGDAYFELAAAERGEARRARFGQAADAYEQATRIAPPGGDIYFLSLYKLGWAYYSQATPASPEAYGRAVGVFGQLVAEYDQLSPAQQSRLGLRREAIDYMAVALTQVGGSAAAERYFATRENAGFKLPVLRRVAASLRDQGEFPEAVSAYRDVIANAPTDSGALAAQREIVDIFRNRMLEPDSAQQARLELVERFAPGTPWAAANPALADSAAAARALALRESGQFALARAQRVGGSERYGEAAALYARYLQEFPQADSAQQARFLLGEALFGQGAYAQAGSEYTRAAYTYPAGDSARAMQAGQNAIVAFDSALTRAPADTAAQDSLFAAVDRFAAAFPQSPVARTALVQKGRRASQAQRWDVMANTFRTYAERYPADPFTPTAQKLVGDALYRRGDYALAQAQWDTAQAVARQRGRGALADTIATLRTSAAASFADTLVRQGEYRRAAEEVYVAFADQNPASPRAPDALRNAIEVYLLADSAARARGDSAASRDARTRAVDLAGRLVTQYPDYRYRTQYASLRAGLLADLGRREEAVAAWNTLIGETPEWPGRADAMVRVAVTLDSLGRPADAAAAYARFASAYPRDARAADAQYNAALTYLQAGDSAAAARAYGAFATVYPRDPRAGAAQQARVALLKAAGDSAAVETELARLCATPQEALRATCAERRGEREFTAGAALYPRYQAMQLVIQSRAQLTRAGVERASARKRALLEQMTTRFKRAIETGVPQWLSAATYYVGLAQWEYGNYLRNLTLPSTLTEAERTAAQQGAEGQAQSYDAGARTAWQGLVDKAAQENFDNEWVARARAALQGNVQTPPFAPGSVPPAGTEAQPAGVSPTSTPPTGTPPTGAPAGGTPPGGTQ